MQIEERIEALVTEGLEMLIGSQSLAGWEPNLQP
jgi:hypothetical protein